MGRRWAAALLLLALSACDRTSADHWKKMYVNEANYHYQTQQIKNAEIAARDMEAENQKKFFAILNDRIQVLEKDSARLREELRGRRLESRGPVAPCNGLVTAVAGEIGLVVLDVGSDKGLLEGDRLEITRAGRKVARVQLERVDRTWSAGKVVDGEGSPLRGDAATLIPK
jgi:hypothetical protein